MAEITRGFTGRNREHTPQLPPGQHLVDGFPVLSAGPARRIAQQDWELFVHNGPGQTKKWSWHRSTAGRRDSSYRTCTSERAPSGSAGLSCRTRTNPGSASRTATTYAVIRGACNGIRGGSERQERGVGEHRGLGASRSGRRQAADGRGRLPGRPLLLTRLEVRGPLGGWFVWHADEPRPVQLVAGDSGVVPIVVMIKARATAATGAPFRLLYSVRPLIFVCGSTPFAERVSALVFRLDPTTALGRCNGCGGTRTLAASSCTARRSATSCAAPAATPCCSPSYDLRRVYRCPPADCPGSAFRKGSARDH